MLGDDLLRIGLVDLGPLIVNSTKATREPIQSVKYLSGSERLLFLSERNLLEWNILSDEVNPFQRQSPHKIIYISVSQGSQQAVLATDYGDIELVDLGAVHNVRTLVQHQKGLTCLAFSDDSQRIVCGYRNGSVNILDARSGSPIQNLKPKTIITGHQKPIAWVGFTGSKNVVSICEGGYLFVYASKQSYRLFKTTPRGDNLLVASTCSAKSIAVASGQEIRIWKQDAPNSYTLVSSISTDEGSIVFIDFIPGGECLFLCRSTSRCELLRVDETPVLAVTMSLPSHPFTQSSRPIALSPDGLQLAFGTADGFIQTVGTGKAVQIDCLRNHTRKAMFTSLSVDGTKAASICIKPSLTDIQDVLIWDLEAASVLQCLRVEGRGIYNVVFSRDSQRIAVISNSGIITIWGTSTGDLISTIGELLPKGIRVLSAATSSDLMRVAIIEHRPSKHGENLRIWNTETGGCKSPQPRHEINPSLTHDAVCFLNNGERVAASSSKGLHIYDIRHMDLQCHSFTFYTRSHYPPVDFPGYQETNGVFSSFWKSKGKGAEAFGEPYSQSPQLLVSPNSSRVAYLFPSGDVYLYDLIQEGEPKRDKFSSDSGVAGRGVSISPDWRFLATVTSKHGVTIWDMSTGTVVSHLNIDKAKVVAVTFSPDSKVIFIVTKTKLLMYDTVYFQVPITVALSAPVRSLLSSSQLGQVIFSLCNNTIVIWDYHKLQITRRFYGYNATT